jgi:hypothetical protein
MVQARLLTASCTTGWLDWIHGELWLLPDGLLRVPLGLKTTVAHGAARTVSNEPEVDELDEMELEQRRHLPKSLWIEASNIASADLRKGLITSRLVVRLRDGRTHKLLWLKADLAAVALRNALVTWGVAA